MQDLHDLICKKKKAVACMSGHLLPSEISPSVIREMSELKIEHDSADKSNANQHRLIQHRLQDVLAIVFLWCAYDNFVVSCVCTYTI